MSLSSAKQKNPVLLSLIILSFLLGCGTKNSDERISPQPEAQISLSSSRLINIPQSFEKECQQNKWVLRYPQTSGEQELLSYIFSFLEANQSLIEKWDKLQRKQSYTCFRVALRNYILEENNE